MIYQSTQQAHPWKATARTFLGGGFLLIMFLDRFN